MAHDLAPRRPLLCDFIEENQLGTVRYGQSDFQSTAHQFPPRDRPIGRAVIVEAETVSFVAL